MAKIHSSLATIRAARSRLLASFDLQLRLSELRKGIAAGAHGNAPALIFQKNATMSHRSQ